MKGLKSAVIWWCSLLSTRAVNILPLFNELTVLVWRENSQNTRSCVFWQQTSPFLLHHRPISVLCMRVLWFYKRRVPLLPAFNIEGATSLLVSDGNNVAAGTQLTGCTYSDQQWRWERKSIARRIHTKWLPTINVRFLRVLHTLK